MSEIFVRVFTILLLAGSNFLHANFYRKSLNECITELTDSISVMDIRLMFPGNVFTTNVNLCEFSSSLLPVCGLSLFSSFMVGLNSLQNVKNCSANILPDDVGLGRCDEAAVMSAEVHVRKTNVAPSGPDTSTMGMLKTAS